MAARKLQRSHAALKGIDPRNGFLSDETLLQFVGGDAFSNILRRYQNDRLRSFRDQYREFDQTMTKTRESNTKHNEKRRKLLNEWLQTVQNYFGYSQFIQESIAHWDGEGVVPYLRSGNGSHSVAVLFAAEDSMPLDVESSGFSLTTSTGEKSNKAQKKETLSEQVERLIKAAGCAEAILFLPHSAYYFRSESQTAGQYLEVRWADILLDDNDAALSLATHILSADFFAYSQTEETAVAEENPEKTDDDSEEEDASGGSVKTQATASSLLFREDLEQARKITEDLHKQVTLALEILINERLDVDAALKQKSKSQNHNDAVAHQLFKDGLFVLYRILFILYAEARRFLPVENPQYASFYSVEHLRNWAEDFLKRERQGHADPEGTYLWGAFESLFTLLRRGVKLSGGEFVSAFNGQLFAPDQTPTFAEGPALRDKAMAQVLLTLTRVGGEESGRRLHFANLGVEQLGAVYEALLAQKPVIVREESLWVPAHGGGVGLVTRKLAEALEMTQFEEPQETGLRARRERRTGRASAGRLDTYISPERPGFNPTIGTFIVAPLGGQKRQTASFYTPPKLAEFLVKRTLKPLVEGKSVKEILGLRIVEPAVGSGGFLIATLRYLGQELLKAKIREKYMEFRGREATHEDLQECKRQILENCLFGVDLNPLSVELCRTSLYLEALVKNQPLPFLHHRLKSGNSLIYADYLNQSKTSWDGHTEFPSIFNIFTEAVDIDKKIFEAWDAKEKAYGRRPNSAEIKEQISEIKSKLKEERSRFYDENWADWAIKMQIELNKMLQLARKAVTEFEKIQEKGEIVDSLDMRHKDRLAWVPELDDVLIEAEGIEIDPKLEAERKKVLIREHGVSAYNQMVRYQRAFSRLKTLGDLWCAQWFWPADMMVCFPTLTVYRELIEFLTNNSTLDRKEKSKTRLSKPAFSCLKIAIETAKRYRFFQWHVEFAQIHADSVSPGFSAVISNPPWKVVGTKDKDVYPEFDPQFLDIKPAQKKQRLENLISASPSISSEWFIRSHFSSRMANLWQQGLMTRQPTQGQLDLAVLFSLGAENLVRKRGRIGMLTSRSAVFSNSATSSLRERFYTDWGLQEATSLANTNYIFEIAGYLQFTCLIGQPGMPLKAPLFVHGITNLCDLDATSLNLDDPTRRSRPHTIALTIEAVRKISRQTLSIPGFVDRRHCEITEAIYQASGPTVYLDEIEAEVRLGVHATSGPRTGLSAFTEDLSSSQKSSLNWIDLYRGRDFDRFSLNNPSHFPQKGNRKELERLGISFDKPFAVWRAISQASDQRTLIVSILPQGCFADGNVYCVQLPQATTEFSLILGSLPLEFITKLQGGARRTLGQILALPLTNYRSGYLSKACEISSRRRILEDELAAIDALTWLHYGINQAALNRDGLIWALENQFDTLARNSPEYVASILKYYDEYSKNKSLRTILEKPIFKLKVKTISAADSDSAKISRRKKRSA